MPRAFLMIDHANTPITRRIHGGIVNKVPLIRVQMSKLRQNIVTVRILVIVLDSQTNIL